MITSSSGGRSSNDNAERPALVNPFPTLLALVAIHAGLQWSQLEQWHASMEWGLQFMFGVASLQVTATALLWMRDWFHVDTGGEIRIRLGKHGRLELGRKHVDDGAPGTNGDGHAST